MIAGPAAQKIAAAADNKRSHGPPLHLLRPEAAALFQIRGHPRDIEIRTQAIWVIHQQNQPEISAAAGDAPRQAMIARYLRRLADFSQLFGRDSAHQAGVIAIKRIPANGPDSANSAEHV